MRYSKVLAIFIMVMLTFLKVQGHLLLRKGSVRPEYS